MIESHPPEEYAFQHPFTSLRPQTMLYLRTLSDTFIETGSNVGLAIQLAIDCRFKRIYSIEAAQQHYETCVQKFASNDSVRLLLGDSPSCLESVLADVDEKAIVYLDAHSVAYNPLLIELLVLKTAPVRNHVILIDDCRMFGTRDWHGITKQQALDLITQINPAYQIAYMDTNNAHADLMVCEVK